MFLEEAALSGQPVRLNKRDHDLLVLKHRLTYIDTPEGTIYSVVRHSSWKLDESVAYSIEESLRLIALAMKDPMPKKAKQSLRKLERDLRAARDRAYDLERERRGVLT